MGIDLLLEHLKMDTLVGKLLSNLTQVQRRAGQAIEPRHDQGIPLAHEVEASLQLRTCRIRPTGFLFVELLTVRQALPLNG